MTGTQQDDWLTHDLPYPLAEQYARLLDALDDAPAAHACALNLVESLAELAACLGLLTRLAAGVLDERIRPTLPRLTRPSFGGWVGLLRAVAAAGPDHDLPDALASFLDTPLPADAREAAGEWVAIVARLFGARGNAPTTSGGLLDLAVRYRNRVAHGADITAADASALVPPMMASVRALLETANFLRRYRLIFVHEAMFDPAERVLHRWTDLTGLRMRKVLQPYVTDERQRLRPAEVYACRLDPDGIVPLVSLYPLVVFSRCGTCLRDQVFLYRSVERGAVSYVSPACTHQHSPKEHLRDVEALLGGRSPALSEPAARSLLAGDDAANVYRRAVERTLADGVVELHERAALDFLREALGVDAETARSIEARASVPVAQPAPDHDAAPATLTSQTVDRDLGYVALTQFLDPDPKTLDVLFAYERQRLHMIARGRDWEYRLRRRGRNVSAIPVPYVREMVSGDTPMAMGDLHPRVTDLIHGRQLRLEVVEDRPCAKAFHIWFPEPLAPGDVFEIEFRCWWFETHLKRHDYIFFPMHLHPRGTDVLDGLLTLPEPAARTVLRRHDGMKLIDVSLSPTVEEQDEFLRYRWRLQPEPALYVVEFERWSEQAAARDGAPGSSRLPRGGLREVSEEG